MNEVRSPSLVDEVVDVFASDSDKIECQSHAYSKTPDAPYFSNESQTEVCYYLKPDGGATKFYSHCGLTDSNDQRRRICACCGGCQFTNPEGADIVNDENRLGNGESFWELFSTSGNIHQGYCGSYNFNERLTDFRVCDSIAGTIDMPQICEQNYQSVHYVLAEKSQSCKKACKNVDQGQYTCDAYETSLIDSVESMRVTSAKVGVHCEQYPGNQDALGSNDYHPSISLADDACHIRKSASAEGICSAAPVDNKTIRRLCACS